MDKQAIAAAIASVWNQYPDARSIPVSTMISCIQYLHGGANSSYGDVRDYITSNCTVVKGAKGGIMRPTLIDKFNASVARDLLKEVTAINDHKCPSCGNDRVSKCEKSCWKCGSNLHK